MSQGNFEGRKFALLIGVSETRSGFEQLQCPPRGVEALRNILTNPDIGGFSRDDVKSLINPNVSTLLESIGEIYIGRNASDLVLFYFTGHGFLDEHGDFFFTTCETVKEQNRFLNRGTAVSASFVRDEMGKSHSRRQVAILDCCFSGAFLDGVLAMGDQTINLGKSLGVSEGRVILTAANSTQYALEQEGEELSVYTRYLVRGLETGADADPGKELINVGDLHNYIREQLRAAAPAMSPQIYAARDGHEIVIGRAIIDNERRFAEHVRQYVRKDGSLSQNARNNLNNFAKSYGISEEEAERIICEITQPYRERQENLEKYKNAYQSEVDDGYPLSEQSRVVLRDSQRILNLRDEDVASIQAQIENEAKEKLKPHSPFWKIPWKVTGIAVLLLGLVVIIYRLWYHPPEPSLQPVKNLISAGDNTDFYGSRSSVLQLEYQPNLRNAIKGFLHKEYEKSLNTLNEILDNGKKKSENDYKSPLKDPEILIFRNNSLARFNYEKSKTPIFTIAAAVPLSDTDGNPFDVGQQILYGIALEQTNAIKQGINLEVVIANDLNIPAQAQEIAKELSKSFITSSNNEQRVILAVIGHYSSPVTCAALPNYQTAGLAVISPTSTLTDMQSKCGGGKVFFRTASSTKKEAEALTKYLSEKSGLRDESIAVFYKKDEMFSKDIRNNFKDLVSNIESKFNLSIKGEFDLSNDSEVAEGKKRINEFNVLAIFPDGRTENNKAFKNALKVIDVARDRLILAANSLDRFDLATLNSTLNTLTIQKGMPGKGLLLAIDWIPDCASKSFLKASEPWGGPPTRVMASSYEAAQVIVDRLNRGITKRSDILNDLGNSNNKVNSDAFAGKTISFEQNGDRIEINKRILVTLSSKLSQYGKQEFGQIPGESKSACL